MNEFGRRVKGFFMEADMFLLSICLVLSGFGVVLISSASRTLPGGPGRYMTIQIAAIILGVIGFIIMSMIDVEHISEAWKIILVFNALFMLSLIPFGVQTDNNRSWIRLEPFLPVGIQPAEIIKITFIVLMAKHMYHLRETLSSVKSMAQIGGHLFLMLALIYVVSSDDGMVVMYFLIFVCMAIAAGVKPRWFILAFGIIAAAAPFVWSHMRDYQQKRILVLLNPELDPLGAGWQTTMSKIALGGGQLAGQGLFEGTQTQYDKLPARQTDFIFSVCGEELGFIGCIALIALLTIIIVRCLYIASRAKTGMSMLVCVGIAGMLISQVIINIGMCVGILPVIGVTLPFVSYGGTSVVALFMAMGLVSGVRMRPMPNWLRDRANIN